MSTFRMSQSEFEDFRDVQIKPRADWPATFSCNQHGQVWPFVVYGYTQEDERLYMENQFTLLDDIVKDVLDVRPEGGRFHLNDRGAFLADDRRQVSRFIVR